MSRPIQLMFQPGGVYKLAVEPSGAELDGHLRVFATSTKRIKGARVYTVVGEIIESGQRVTIRLTDDGG